MKGFRGVLVLFLLALVTACAAQFQLVPARAEVSTFIIEKPRPQVFDIALLVAQELNLDVAVLEKESGLLRFETALLSPEQLDRYVRYPFVHAGTDRPLNTFSNWHQRSVSGGAGPVRGKVSLTLLLSDESGGRTRAILRTNWTAQNNRETFAVNSNGNFEADFEVALRARAASP